MKRPCALLMLTAVGLVSVEGCCSHERRSSFFAPAPPPAPCGTCGVNAPPGRLVPIGAPPPAALGRPMPAPPAETPPPPEGPPSSFRPEPPPSPPGPGARLLPPKDSNPGPRESARFSPPAPEPPVDSGPAKAAPAEEGDLALPVDILQFALVRPRVASGQQPFLDGVDWLKSRNYKTVLHVRAPGEDNSAARRQFERKGLIYLSLEVSPATLTREIVKEFDRIVTNADNLPLFVYDKDSSVLGGLWYLHFRGHGRLSDERARREAMRLGFKVEDDPEHRTMWVAVQNLLKPPGE